MSKVPFINSKSNGWGNPSYGISRLECHYGDGEGLYCNHGCLKAVNIARRKELDGSEMLLPKLDFPAQVNSVCEKCVDASEIPNKISIRKSLTETILKDLEVSGVIVCEKHLRK